MMPLRFAHWPPGRHALSPLYAGRSPFKAQKKSEERTMETQAVLHLILDKLGGIEDRLTSVEDRLVSVEGRLG